MNEILATLVFGLYPFYFSFDRKSNISAVTITQYNTNSDGLSRELYSFLYDEDELQADLYILFDQIMKRGILDLYNIKEEGSKSINRDSGVTFVLLRKRKISFTYRIRMTLAETRSRILL